MPWRAIKSKKGADIIRSDTGKVVGHSSSLSKAKASVRARYANTPEAVLKGMREHQKKYRKRK